MAFWSPLYQERRDSGRDENGQLTLFNQVNILGGENKSDDGHYWDSSNLEWRNRYDDFYIQTTSIVWLLVIIAILVFAGDILLYQLLHKNWYV